MAIVSVSRHWRVHEITQDDSLAKVLRETWFVVVDSTLDDPEVIRTAVDPNTAETIPAMYDVWDGYASGQADATLLARSIRPRQTDDVFTWEVEVEYSNETTVGPIWPNKPATEEWSGQTVKRSVQQDVRGRALVNSVGDPFDPPFEVGETELVLRINRNEAGFLPTIIPTYQNKVNTDEWRGFAPHQVLCKEIRARDERQGGYTFHAVSYEFHIRVTENGWDQPILDAGFEKYILDADNEPQPIDPLDLTRGYKRRRIQREGIPSAQPTPLDGRGGELKDAFTLIEDIGGITEITVTFNVQDTRKVVKYDFPILIRIDNELMYITASSGDIGGSITVERAQKGTEAVAHDEDAIVQLEPVFFLYEFHESVEFASLGLGG